MTNDARRRVGRPMRRVDDRREYYLGIKASRELKRRLVETATANGCSLSEECRSGLERSFRDDDVEAMVKRWTGQ